MNCKMRIRCISRDSAAPCHAFIDDWITTRFWENDSLIDNVQWDMQTKHSPATKIKMDSVYIYAMKCKQGKEKVWATWYSSTGVSQKNVNHSRRAGDILCLPLGSSCHDSWRQRYLSQEPLPPRVQMFPSSRNSPSLLLRLKRARRHSTKCLLLNYVTLRRIIISLPHASIEKRH